MPRCEKQECDKTDLSPEEIHEDAHTGQLFCGDCAEEHQVVKLPIRDEDLVLGRVYDYGLSYTKQDGFKASARLGGARLSIQVDPEELDRTFGPSK